MSYRITWKFRNIIQTNKLPGKPKQVQKYPGKHVPPRVLTEPPTVLVLPMRAYKKERFDSWSLIFAIKKIKINKTVKNLREIRSFEKLEKR